MTERLSVLQKILIAIDLAMLDSVAKNGGVVEFSLDTGQGKQTVKRYDLTQLTNLKNSIKDEIDEIQSDAVGKVRYMRNRW